MNKVLVIAEGIDGWSDEYATTEISGFGQMLHEASLDKSFWDQLAVTELGRGNKIPPI